MQPAVEAGGWQVVERLGDARFHAPAAGGWSPAMPASRLPDGSRLVTGVGGRLIVARQGEHISAGPASRFTLPDGAPGARLEQQAGSLRYRVAGTPPGGLVVVTPFLEIEVAGTVFDVTVSATATEVSVQEGGVRIVTPDGLHQLELGAGQSAYAGGANGAALAFQRAPGAPLEQVEAIVLPAIHPRPGPREGRVLVPGRPADYAGSQASTSGAAVSQAAVPVARAEIAANAAGDPARARAGGPVIPAKAAIRATPAVAPSVDGARIMPPLSEAARNALARQEPGEQVPENAPPTAFDRLSEGMVRGVPGALPSRRPAFDARSF